MSLCDLLNRPNRRFCVYFQPSKIIRGIAAFSVWGEKEKSNLFTTIPRLIAAKHGPQESNERSQFYLNDKKVLREIILAAGVQASLTSLRW